LWLATRAGKPNPAPLVCFSVRDRTSYVAALLNERSEAGIFAPHSFSRLEEI